MAMAFLRFTPETQSIKETVVIYLFRIKTCALQMTTSGGGRWKVTSCQKNAEDTHVKDCCLEYTKHLFKKPPTNNTIKNQ